jgi:choline-sulfatase
MPKKNNSPGKSFCSVLKGQPINRNEPIVIFDEYGPVRMIRNEKWKYVYRYPSGPHELYDLYADPDERINLVENGEHRKIISELKFQMDAWFDKYVLPSKNGLLQDGTAYGQSSLV